MKFDEFPSVERLEFWAEPAAPGRTTHDLRKGPATLRAHATPGEYWLVQAEARAQEAFGAEEDSGEGKDSGEAEPARSAASLRVRVPDVDARLALDRILARNAARLVSVELKHDGNGSICATLLSYVGAPLDLHKIQIDPQGTVLEEARIGLDEKTLETARRKWPTISMEGLAQKLKALCAPQDASGEPEDFFFLHVGGKVGEDETEQRLQGGFTLMGAGVEIAVRPVERRKGERILKAESLRFSGKKKQDRPVRLAYGRVSFCDESLAGILRATAAEAMKTLIEQEDGYLRRWDAYGELEGEALLRKAREVGALRFSASEPAPEGIRFHLDHPTPAGISKGDSLEILRQPPPWLEDPAMTWSAAQEEMTAPGPDGRRASRNDFLQVVETGQSSITLKLERSPLDAGFLALSLSGDLVQIERRRRARSLILEGRSANPTLGLIIEEGGDPPPSRPLPRLPALSARVRDKIFRHEPTETQIRAIDAALNTPDIAIIQGPPGTGKTTVISAIVERLNEEHDATRSVTGKVLVTGFQHDAVENIVSRLSVNSLPPVKFGKRAQGEASAALEERAAQWRRDLAERIRARNPEVRPLEEESLLADAVALYVGSPSAPNALAALERVFAAPRRLIDQETARRARALADRLREEAEDRADPARDETMAAIRRLRTSEAGFADDGPDCAAEVLAACGGRLGGEDADLLRRAASWRREKPLDFLSGLRLLKRGLLSLYGPPAVFRVNKPHDETLKLLVSALRSMEEARRRESDPTNAILADLLRQLETAPQSVDAAIQDYNFVFAATCQQAEGGDIRRAKLRDDQTDEEKRIVYDSVIVDEAARVAPRDLLIPMVQGKRRIVLVGDHRQLPHIIDEEIARAVEAEDIDAPPASAEAWASRGKGGMIETSMFEHLIGRLRKLEEKDGVARIVTLDAQYRMHPQLGRFVSDQFYAPHGEGYASPLPGDLFAHRLPQTQGAAAVWLEVPAARGREKKHGPSRHRLCEAEAVAERLASWIDSEEGRGLSFGVISFYKAQVEAIKEALLRRGLTERTPDGSLVVAEAYRLLPPGRNGAAPEERLRIGTVDAFQGKEFDVAILSMTRSAPMDAPGARPIPASRLFGHLISPNRLCVSMSRQKRLLAVAGDSGLLRRPEAEQAIPALRAFHRLCRDHGALT